MFVLKIQEKIPGIYFVEGMKDSSNVEDKGSQTHWSQDSFKNLFLIIEDPKEHLFIWVILINTYCIRIKHKCTQFHKFCIPFQRTLGLPLWPIHRLQVETSNNIKFEVRINVQGKSNFARIIWIGSKKQTTQLWLSVATPKTLNHVAALDEL